MFIRQCFNLICFTVLKLLKKVFFNFLIRVKCQPTDADHEGTSIEEDEVVLKKASKKDKKEVQKSSVSVRPRKRKITSQKDAISDYLQLLRISNKHKINESKLGFRQIREGKKHFLNIRRNRQNSTDNMNCV